LGVANIKSVPTGFDHGTVTAVVDGVPFEITTLRRDTACDGRHADVAFTTDWHEDSQRRDFTMNAMSLRLDGTLFDDHGGIEDAKAGRLRFVGSPADRIKEDYLRILRLFRLFALYGRGTLDGEILGACQIGAVSLQKLSAERVQKEILKLFSAPNPGPAVMAMCECDVLQVVLPEASEPSVLSNLLNLEVEAPAFPSDWLRRLAVLIPAALAASLATRLKFSNADKNRLRALTDTKAIVDGNASGVELKRAIYKYGAALTVDRVVVAWARRDAFDEDEAALWRAQINEAVHWIPRQLPVTGDDVLALGVFPGLEVGECLAEVENLWIAGGFEMSRDELLNELRRIGNSK
jgi:poly(A) polymerase